MIQIIVTAANKAARDLIPDPLILRYNDSVRISKIEPQIREYFKAEGFFLRGEEYDMKAILPKEHIDATR